MREGTTGGRGAAGRRGRAWLAAAGAWVAVIALAWPGGSGALAQPVRRVGTQPVRRTVAEPARSATDPTGWGVATLGYEAGPGEGEGVGGAGGGGGGGGIVGVIEGVAGEIARSGAGGGGDRGAGGERPTASVEVPVRGLFRRDVLTGIAGVVLEVGEPVVRIDRRISPREALALEAEAAEFVAGLHEWSRVLDDETLAASEGVAAEGDAGERDEDVYAFRFPEAYAGLGLFAGESPEVRVRLDWTPVEVATPRLRVVHHRGAGPGEDATIVNSYDRLRLELHMPRAAAAAAGEELDVEISSEATGDDESLTLSSRGSAARGSVVYRAPAFTLAEGGEGAGVVDAGDLADLPLGGLGDLLPERVAGMLEFSTGGFGRLLTENGDTVTFTAEGAEPVTVRVYDTAIQQSIAADLGTLDALEPVYRALLGDPRLTESDREVLRRKLALIENARRLAAIEPGAIERWTDFSRMFALRGYVGLIESDPRTWDERGRGSVNRVLGITYGSMDEVETVNAALTRAQDTQRDRFLQTMRDATIGAYQVFASFTGGEALWILATDTDAMGKRVDRTRRVLAGLEVLANFAGTGAGLVAAERAAIAGNSGARSLGLRLAQRGESAAERKLGRRLLLDGDPAMTNAALQARETARAARRAAEKADADEAAAGAARAGDDAAAAVDDVAAGGAGGAGGGGGGAGRPAAEVQTTAAVPAERPLGEAPDGAAGTARPATGEAVAAGERPGPATTAGAADETTKFDDPGFAEAAAAEREGAAAARADAPADAAAAGRTDGQAAARADAAVEAPRDATAGDAARAERPTPSVDADGTVRFDEAEMPVAVADRPARRFADRDRLPPDPDRVRPADEPVGPVAAREEAGPGPGTGAGRRGDDAAFERTARDDPPANSVRREGDVASPAVEDANPTARLPDAPGAGELPKTERVPAPGAGELPKTERVPGPGEPVVPGGEALASASVSAGGRSSASASASPSAGPGAGPGRGRPSSRVQDPFEETVSWQPGEAAAARADDVAAAAAEVRAGSPGAAVPGRPGASPSRRVSEVTEAPSAPRNQPIRDPDEAPRGVGDETLDAPGPNGAAAAEVGSADKTPVYPGPDAAGVPGGAAAAGPGGGLAAVPERPFVAPNRAFTQTPRVVGGPGGRRPVGVTPPPGAVVVDAAPVPGQINPNAVYTRLPPAPPRGAPRAGNFLYDAGDGNVYQLGEGLGQGAFSQVYRLAGEGNDGLVIKFRMRGEAQSRARSQAAIDADRAAGVRDPSHQEVIEITTEDMLESARRASEDLERIGVAQARVHSVHPDAQHPYMIVEEARGPDVRIYDVADFRDEFGRRTTPSDWTKEHQRSVLELYDRLAKAGYVAEDLKVDNLFFRKSPDGKVTAGVLDHDRIGRFDDVYFQTMAQDMVLMQRMPGRKHAVAMYSLETHGVDFQFRDARHFMTGMLEHKGWIQYTGPEGFSGLKIDPDLARDYFNIDGMIGPRGRPAAGGGADGAWLPLRAWPLCEPSGDVWALRREEPVHARAAA